MNSARAAPELLTNKCDEPPNARPYIQRASIDPMSSRVGAGDSLSLSPKRPRRGRTGGRGETGAGVNKSGDSTDEMSTRREVNYVRAPFLW